MTVDANADIVLSIPTRYTLKLKENLTMKFMNNEKMNGLISAESPEAASTGTVDTQTKPQEGNGLVDTTIEQTQEVQATQQESVHNGLVTTTAPMDEQPNTQVAVAQNTAVATSDAQTYTAGGEDVDASELGYGAFPKLKIENGEFDLDKQSAGKKLLVAVMNRRVQRLIKPAGVSDPSKDQMAYYTVVPGVNPDNLLTTKGQKTSEFKQMLREEGLKAEEVEYEMVGVQILKFPKEVGNIVPVGTLAEMQIPQASMQRFRGLMFNARKADIPMGQRVLQVAVGPKTQGNGGTYNPWVIDAVNGTAEEICAKLGIELGAVSGIDADDLDF